MVSDFAIHVNKFLGEFDVRAGERRQGSLERLAISVTSCRDPPDWHRGAREQRQSCSKHHPAGADSPIPVSAPGDTRVAAVDPAAPRQPGLLALQDSSGIDSASGDGDSNCSPTRCASGGHSLSHAVSPLVQYATALYYPRRVGRLPPQIGSSHYWSSCTWTDQG